MALAAPLFCKLFNLHSFNGEGPVDNRLLASTKTRGQFTVMLLFQQEFVS